MKANLPVPVAGTALDLRDPVTASGHIPFAYTERGTFELYPDNRHLLTFGPNRSGKGATVIIPTLLLVSHSVLCLDPKGQNAWVTRRRRHEMGQDVHLLNPFDVLGMGSSYFNPLADLRITDRNIVADVRSIADAMVISEDGAGRHFTDSALDLLTGLMLYLVATASETEKPTLADMRELLTGPYSDLTDVINKAILLTDYPFIAQFLGRFGSGSKEIMSIISTAITQTTMLSDQSIARVLGKNPWEGSRELKLRWLREGPTTVYLVLPGGLIDIYGRFFRLVVQRALDTLTSEPGGYKTLLLLDEMATLSKLPAIARAFGYAAGYNVQCWGFLQDLPQLIDIYGKRYESFMANAGMIQLFTPADPRTADWLQNRAGNIQIERMNISQGEVNDEQRKQGMSGWSRSWSMEMVPLYPQPISMSLHRSRQVVFFAGEHSAYECGRCDYRFIPRLQGMWDPDPFHT